MYTVSSIRISVNDASETTAITTTSGSPFCFSSNDSFMSLHGQSPLRAARSLSRLDAMLKAEQFAAATTVASASAGDEFDETDCVLAYRCGSFPRLDREVGCTSLHAAAARIYLDTDSMSPRLSNATLSQDLDGEMLALSVVNLGLPPIEMKSSLSSGSGHVTSLTRSASARTVRAQVSNGGTSSAGVQTGSTRWLPVSGGEAPGSEQGVGRRFCRSASCPCFLPSTQLARSTSSAFGFARLLPPPPGSRALRTNLQRPYSKPKSSSSVTAAKLTSAPGRGRPHFDADVDLHSEQVTDLPVDIGQDVPDFVPDRQFSAGSMTASNGTLDGRLPFSGTRRPLSTIELSSTTLVRHLADNVDPVTVGDLPASSRNVGLHRPFRQRPPQLVEFKCIKWLQSLDIGATER